MNIYNNLLIEAYEKAIELELSPDFIKLLRNEIMKRNIATKIQEVSIDETLSRNK